MKAQIGSHDDGMIGLGVLAMLTIALIASLAQDSVETAAAAATTPETRTVMFSDEGYRPGRVAGAIRELKILPTFIQSSADLDWSADEDLLDDYRNRGF